MSKAGNRRLRTQLLRSAETARQHDPQLAAIFYDQMVNKGAVHLKALCVVAARLAERAWTVMHRGSPYQLRDTDGIPVDRATAKQIIAERFTVPEEIRRQRRSKKVGGRAPHQVLEGRVSSQRSRRDNTGDPPRPQACPAGARLSRPSAARHATRPARITPADTGREGFRPGDAEPGSAPSEHRA